MAIKVKDTLFEGKSAYQDVKVFEIDSHATLLARVHVNTHTYTYILAHASV
jgi:spermidine synthase